MPVFTALGGAAVGPVARRAFPEVEIASDCLRATVCLPSARDGFYRGTRFDWSGVLSSLNYRGHQYYGPWYTRLVPEVYDFTCDEADILVGAQSAMTGPAEEFAQPQGYDTAAVGTRSSRSASACCAGRMKHLTAATGLRDCRLG